MSRNAPITASADVEPKSEKLELDSSTKKVRLDRASSGSFKDSLACVINRSNDDEEINLS